MSRSWFRSWLKQKSRRSSRRGHPRRFREVVLAVEGLEDRTLLSAVTWINPSVGNWDQGANWSNGSVPGVGDTAIINTDVAATITIHFGDAIQVQGVTTASNDTLSITGGSLTVTTGDSMLSGPLTMTGGVLTANGPGVTVTADGNTTVSGASLYAKAGGALNLLRLASYANSVYRSSTYFDAIGSGSSVNLPNLSTTGALEGIWYIQASQGGHMQLPALTYVPAGYSNNTEVTADGAGSTIDLSSLTALDGGLGGGLLEVTHQGAVLANRLGWLDHVHVVLDGTGTVPTAQWETLNDGSIDAQGGSYDLKALTQMNDSSLKAEGGASLSLPAVTNLSGGLVGQSFSAIGSGSRLALPNLSAFSPLDPPSVWQISATQGGQVAMPSLTNFGNPNLSLGSLAVDDGSLSLGGGTPTMPPSGTAVTISVPPQFPVGVSLSLGSSGVFSGGTTFNIPAGGHFITLKGGTFTGGVTFNVGQGSAAYLTVGGADQQTVTYSGTLAGAGEGTVRLLGGTVAVGFGGLTMNFPGGMFQWTSGAIDSAKGDLTNIGTINLAGTDNDFKFFFNDGTLDNFGSIIQTGSSNLGLHSDNISPTTLKNEPGASYRIESDAGINNPYGGKVAVVNAGTIIKTDGSKTSDLLINGVLSNTGTIESDSGTLYLHANSIAQVVGTGLTGGTWRAFNGATLKFPTNTVITANAANISLGGAGAKITGLGGDLTNSGSLTVGTALALTGNFTQTSTGTLSVQIGGSASGQFGQLAVGKAATLGGTLNVALVNGFVPAASQDFMVMSFASASGTFGTLTGLDPFFTQKLGPTSLDLMTAATNLVDLAVSGVVAPTTATAGQRITVSWQATDQSSQAASGSWQDSVYLSTTPTITSSSILLGTAIHTGGLAAGRSYSGSLTAAVPALPPGYYYALVQVDSLHQEPDPNRANNTTAAGTGQLQVAVPALALGTPLRDSFTAADQNHYYQITVPAGGTLAVALKSDASSGATALYVSQATLPTLYNYQEAANVPNQPDQTLTVPQVLTDGTYYILAHSVAGSAATASYMLTATQSSVVAVSAISPSSGGNAGNVTIEIDGTNLSSTATAHLTLGGKTIPASAIDFVSAKQVFATFNLTGATPGNYTLSVQQGGQSAQAPGTFKVVAVNPAELNVELSVPQYVRSGRTGTIVISYTNPNANDMVAPLLTIDSTNANVLFSTPDDPNNFVQQAQILAVAPSGPAGILRPGQSGQLTLTLLSNDTIDNDPIPIQVSQIEVGKSIDWASQKTSLQPSSIPTAAWNVIFNNLLATLGTTTDSYNAALGLAATYLSGLGESTAEVSNIGRLWSFLVSQANAAYPTGTLSTVDASLPTPGSLALAIDRTFVSTIAGRYTSGIFGFGWVTSWQTSLSTDSAGNVTINSGGSLGFFVRQANGSYLDTDGEYGTLTNGSGVYTFTNTAGTKYVFLANGQLSYVQDTNGNRITLGYNAQNQLVTLTYANPADPSEPTEQLTLTYAQGLVHQVADGTGHTWTYNYDSAGHLRSVIGPGNLTIAYTYDTGTNPATANALLSITYIDGSQRNFTYDGQGRLSGSSRNNGADPITYGYPGEAMVTTTDAAHNQTTVWFNDLALPSRIQDPRGALTSYLYDTNDNLIGYTDAVGDMYRYTYDGSGNLTQSINPLGQTVQATYGPLSNLTSLTDAAGNKTLYGYDAAGNLLSIAYPGGSHQSFTYDPLGNLSETTLQNGDPIRYQYSAQGLVKQETFADGSYQTFDYDAHGNLRTAKTFNASGALTGTTTLMYNDANELTSIAYPDGRYLNFTYNPATGQRTKSVDQDGFTVNYTYDALGRLYQLKDGSGNLIVQYTYNNLGQLQKKQNGNGTYTTYGYDATGNLTSIVNYAGGTTVNSSLTYTYNLLGEQTSMTDATGTTMYGYDATGQLTQVKLPGGHQTITYVYNAAGDRTEVITNGTTSIYASNADNEITQVGSDIYTYDANGNLHTVTDASGTTTYTFNDLNQLVSIKAPDGTTTTFQYSPLGFQVGMSATSHGRTGQTNYLVDPVGLGNVVASYDGTSSLVACYMYGLGLVSQTGPNGTGYYDFDDTGNTVGITGSNGTYVNHYSYLPFGETTASAAALPNPFTFGGQVGVMQNGSDVFYMRARDYTPETGQFLSNDPMGFTAGDSNLRRFVGNRPTTSVDPTGLDAAPAPDLSNTTAYTVQTPLYISGDFPGPGASSWTFGQDLTGAHEQIIWVDNDTGAFVYDLGYGSNSEYIRLPKIIPLKITSGPVDGPEVKKIVDEIKPEFVRKGKYNIFNPTRPLCDCQTFARKVRDTYNKRSSDPNTLVGPTGYGRQGFIQPTGSWSYTVDFENDGSAAAQDVTVTEQLDTNLDWSTFQLGSFGFGSVHVTIPAGLAQYQTTVACQNTDGSPLNVQVTLDFNVQTGLLTATLTSLDPATGEAPTGVFDGFLPPDDKNGIGEGFVQYTIQPKAGLATGATIKQQASVIFDTNAAIATDPAVNTIDSGPPTSSVHALSARQSATSFTVSWSGQDDSGGSGIAFYDIYVSDNGGPFSLFLSHTTQTSATFTGVFGHTYGFYSVATDNVGNREATPTMAQAITVVSLVSAEDVFVIGLDDQVYVQKFDATGHPVGGYFLTQPGRVKSLTVGHTPDANPELFVMGLDSQVYAQKFDANGNSASGYFLVQRGQVRAVTVGYTANGNPELFVIGLDDQVYAQKLDAHGNPVGDYFLVQAGQIKQLAVGEDAALDPELFVRGLDDQVWAQKMGAAGNALGSYFLTQKGQVKDLSVTQDAAQHPELFVIGLDNQVYGQKFDAAGNSASGYFLTQPGQVKALSASHDAAGDPELFVMGLDDQIYAQKLDGTGNPSRGYFLTQLGRVKSLDSGFDAGGNPELFVKGLDDQVWAQLFDGLGSSLGSYFLMDQGQVKTLSTAI